MMHEMEISENGSVDVDTKRLRESDGDQNDILKSAKIEFEKPTTELVIEEHMDDSGDSEYSNYSNFSVLGNVLHKDMECIGVDKIVNESSSSSASVFPVRSTIHKTFAKTDHGEHPVGLQITENNSISDVNQIGVASQLEKEIIFLASLLKSKEKEWDAILKLKKSKEIMLERVRRQSEVNRLLISQTRNEVDVNSSVDKILVEKIEVSASSKKARNVTTFERSQNQSQYISKKNISLQPKMVQPTNCSFKDALVLLANKSRQNKKIVTSKTLNTSTAKPKIIRATEVSTRVPLFSKAPMVKTLAKLLSSKSSVTTANRLEDVLSSQINPLPLKNVVPSEGTLSQSNLLASAKCRDEEVKPKEEISLCQGCNAHRAQFVCAGCGNQWYCSRECQISAWGKHSDCCSSG